MKGRCLRLFTHTRKAHTHIRHFPEKHGIPMLRRLALQGRHEALRFKATDVNIGTLAAKLTEEAVWASASKI